MEGKIKNIHFIGIGGIGMSGLAEICLNSGFSVSGSDISPSKITKRLKNLGAVIYNGHSEENIKDCDIVVFSSAISKDNSELVCAKKRNIPVIKRGRFLSEIIGMAETVAVCGAHGKTTTNVITGPYPSFSTDFQPLICSLMSIAKGTSIVKETVFDNRIAHTYELLRMGANVKIVGEQTIIIEGVKGLHGANVMAGDIRCGAGLVLAGLSAKGRTIVDRVYHIDRGYERLEERLSLLGANIWREK